ncbi:MAG: PKD domain-containing protein, partial [Chloroflexota bacterium]
ENFQAFSGTSMAAPHVAGAWAIMKEVYPNDSVSQTLNRFVNTGTPIEDQRAGGTTTVPKIELGNIFGPNLEINPTELNYAASEGEISVSLPISFTNSGQSDLTFSLSAAAEDARQPDDEIRLTHSLSKEIVDGNSATCALGGQSWMRVFDLPEFEVNEAFEVSAVEFGVQQATSFFIPPTVTARLYALDGDVPELDKLTLLAETSGAVSDQSLSIVSIPISAEIPAGTKLVVELNNPAPFLLESLVFGSNSAGQNDPTYYYAPDCSVNEIVDISTQGFPDMHLVLEVVGEIAEPPPACNVWVSSNQMTVHPTSGVIAPNDQSGIAVDIDLSNFEPGEHLSHVCFDTNVANNAQVIVPIMINVPCPAGEDCEPAATPSPTPEMTPSPEPSATPGPDDSPQALFTTSVDMGVAPLEVQFTNQSAGTIVMTEWDFGDGQSGTGLSPSHIYAQAGTYTAKLTVSNDNGSSSFEQSIEVFEAVTVAFFANQQEFDQPPASVTFSNDSTGDFDTCIWDLGDGSQHSDCGSVSHTYTAPGDYTVSLTISGNGGSDSMTRTGYIVVAPDPVQGLKESSFLPLIVR